MTFDPDFESKHPRGPDGRFIPSGGGWMSDSLEGVDDGHGAVPLELLKERHKLVEEVTREVAKKLGFEGGIDIKDTLMPGFEVNGKTMFAAGRAHIAGPFLDRKIEMYTRGFLFSTREQIAGVAAHEIEHQKFQTFLDAKSVELHEIEKMPHNSVPVQVNTGTDHPETVMRDVMKPDGLLREPYDKKFPVYTANEKLLSGNHDTMSYAKGDGVTNYSVEYWQQWAKDRVGSDENRENPAPQMSSTLAMHETMAEMAMTKMTTGKLPEAKDYYGYRSLHYRATLQAMESSTGKFPNPIDMKPIARTTMEKGAAQWRALYKAVDETYERAKQDMVDDAGDVLAASERGRGRMQ